MCEDHLPNGRDYLQRGMEQGSSNEHATVLPVQVGALAQYFTCNPEPSGSISSIVAMAANVRVHIRLLSYPMFTKQT